MTESYVHGIPLPTQPPAYALTRKYVDAAGTQYEVTAKRHHDAWDVGVDRMQMKDGQVVGRKAVAGWVWAGNETVTEACDVGWRRYREGQGS